MGSATSDPPDDGDRPLTMKERAAKARHEAYAAAKERRKNDPRTAELKARVKAARREASAKAKELRKTDPKLIARKEKLKEDRRAASAQRKTERKAAKMSDRDKDGEPVRSRMLELIDGGAGALAAPRAGALASVRAALSVIEGGKSQTTAAKSPYREAP